MYSKKFRQILNFASSIIKLQFSLLFQFFEVHWKSPNCGVVPIWLSNSSSEVQPLVNGHMTESLINNLGPQNYVHVFVKFRIAPLKMKWHLQKDIFKKMRFRLCLVLYTWRLVWNHWSTGSQKFSASSPISLVLCSLGSGGLEASKRFFCFRS